MAWSPQARARAAAAAARQQKSGGGFTNRPEHASSVTGMGVPKHGVAQPHAQAPHVLPPEGMVHTADTVEAHIRAGGTYSSYAKIPKSQKSKNGKKIKGKANVAAAIARSNAIIAHGNKYGRR